MFRNIYHVFQLSVVVLLLSATEVSAQGAEAARSFVAKLNNIFLFPLIGLLMGVAFLLFLWGCAQYVMGANNPSAREQGVKHITFGIIGLVVMVSAWAILGIAAATFGLSVPT